MTSVPVAAPAAPLGGTKNLVVDLATVIVGRWLGVVHADAGFVATVADDARTLTVARVTPYSEGAVRLVMPLDAPYPLAEAIRTRRPLFIENNEQLACDHPGLVRVVSEDHACATLPLLDEDGELLGALNLGYEEPHAFSQDELDAIQTLARHCTEAMAVARRVEADARRRAHGSSA